MWVVSTSCLIGSNSIFLFLKQGSWPLARNSQPLRLFWLDPEASGRLLFVGPYDVHIPYHNLTHRVHTAERAMSVSAPSSTEATATTPLLSPPRPPGTATTNDKGDAASPPSPPPPWTHDLGRQLRLQLLLSGLAFLLALFVVLAAALVGLPADDDGGDRRETGGWAVASLALGGVGMVLDAAGLVAVLRQGRRLRSPLGLEEESVAAPDTDDGDSSSGSPSPSLLLPLTLQLLFNAGAFTPCRIVGTVLSFTGSSSSSPSSCVGPLALDAALTGAVALASLGQLLVSVYFFKCLRTFRAVPVVDSMTSPTTELILTTIVCQTRQAFTERSRRPWGACGGKGRAAEEEEGPRRKRRGSRARP